MKEASTSSCRPTIQATCPTATSRCAHRPTSPIALLRSNYRSADDADIADAVAYGKQVRVYPLSAAADPPQTTFIDAIDVLFDATIPYDARYFDALNRIVQAEPWLARDRAMIDSLKTIGIEKGKPFAPGGKARRIFESRRARSARVAGQPVGRRRTFRPPYFDGGHWHVPASDEVVEGMTTNFADPDSYPVDNRAVTYSIAFFSAKHLGAGQFYLMCIKDKAGNSLDGGMPPIVSAYPRPHRCSNTGRRPPMTVRPTP